MMGLFAGFLVLMIVVAVVIVKMNQKSANTPGKQVVTKTYKQRDQQAGAAAPAASEPVALQPGAAGTGEQQAAFQPVPQNGAAVAGQGVAVAQGVGSAATAAAGNQMMGLPAPQQAAAVTNVPVDLGQRLTNIDNSLSSLDARVTALEGKRAGTSSTARKTSTPRTTQAAAKKPAEDKEKSLSDMPGYKSMAVVSNRAWVAAPDGNEDSVTKGELLPRARVRSMNVETGVVVTTTDQRIDPR
ncbi:hypothetical protein [uncultured Zoogloea sp.]|uniref:hypothetical protein n=1 Tax=uncultured Zoogloea sp. TaxID=160237 RepID=UPI00261D6E95|nr:hypothetical protein [uncultured Zoogloea sp.]